MNDQPRYASLRDYLRVLREQRILIVLLTLVAGGVALFVSSRDTPVYTATSAIAFEDETQQLSVLGGSVNPKTPTSQTPQARARTIDEPEVIEEVAKSLPRDQRISPAEVRSAVSTTLNEESFLVDIAADWDDADFAARLANDFAQTAARYTNQQTRKEYRAALDGVRARIDSLGAAPEEQTEKLALTEQLTRLRFLADNAEPARVAETAEPPGAPTSPNTRRNTALGLLLGLVLGILVAFLRDTLDRRLRSSREVQEELGYPVLGHVRDQALGQVLRVGITRDERLEPDLEALRIVRQNLEFLPGRDRDLRTIVVTSPLPAEGKTTVATALAFASAAAGQRTLLVECDLRRPDLAARLRLRPTPGLTDFLVGSAEPREILQLVVPVAAESGLPNNGPGPAGVPGVEAQSLVCITCGSGSPSPTELLGSERFEQFLTEVSEAYDTVVIDATPLLPVADALELLPHADGVILCVRSGQTTREQARLAKSALEHYPEERPVGVVVTGLKRSDERDYGYYSYAYPNQAGLQAKTPA